MTSKEFISVAAISAQIYHDWLDEQGKGLATIRINRYEVLDNGDIKLFCNESVAFLEDVQIRIGTYIYPKDEIQIKKYDRKNRALFIVPRKDLYWLFEKTSPSDIFIVSDLKFLIKRVQSWYENYKGKLSLPFAMPTLNTQIPELKDKPSPEQLNAFKGIANSPFSYIWGAPGTGKTQFVLSRAVLSYCKENKPVLITAPTNNAVEQTMKGVLSVLKEAGVPFERVLRLGIPSTEFYAEYPMVCEVKPLEDELKYLESQEQELEQYIKKISVFLLADNWCTKEEITFSVVQQTICELSNEKLNLEKEITQKKNELKVRAARFAPILAEIDRFNQKHREVNAYLNKHRAGITALFQKKRIILAESERANIESNLEKQGVLHEQLLKEQKQAEKEINDMASREKAATEEIKHQFQKLRNMETCPELAAITHDYQYLKNSLTLEKPYREILQKAEITLRKIREIIEERRVNYESESLDEANLELDAIRQRKNLIASSLSQRIKDTLVIGATVDGYINKLVDDSSFQPVHIFLDEAAYCPLIKSAVLLSQNVPITLLGDHMQLPPVCEMPNELFDKEHYMPVCLWAQSSLYLGAVFSQTLKEIKEQYMSETKDVSIISLPFQETMKQFNLQHTFRFGEGLAKVLSRYVYTEQFCGNPNIETSVIVINVPKTPEDEKNVNLDECEAIKKYLQVQEHSFSSSYAILTPYRNQLKALLATVFPVGVVDKADHVFTIHGSQGREWDTVFISVVSTFNHRFLTRRLLNTAVSRAKKQLILVCDSSYWSAQTDHIIGGLIAAAKE